MSDILVESAYYISTSDACIVDLTPPTFSGLISLDVESRGQIRAIWTTATDANTPIRYEVYIQEATATGLFNTSNITGITDKLQLDIFTLPDGSFLENGSVYYVGVRALDSISNRDSNTVSLNVVSTGILTSIDIYKNEAVFSVNHSNQFLGTLWSTKNGNLATNSNSVLGTASYQVYDKAGNAIVGMSETGIVVNGEGVYVISAVPNLLTDELSHYVVKVSINVDSEVRVNNIAIEDKMSSYEILGTSSIDSDNNLIGSFWIVVDEVIQTDHLGTGSYQVFSPDGTLIPGLSESGITPDINGFFPVTPFPLPGSLDTTIDYIVKVTLTVNGITKSKNIVLQASPTQYTCKAVFSINSSNQLEATFWSTQNDELSDPSILGNASYQIYDKLGAAVVGLTQSGITSDVNGFFHITPVSASLLTDLTHYVAKITIDVAGQDRTVSKGFTLLGT